MGKKLQLLSLFTGLLLSSCFNKLSVDQKARKTLGVQDTQSREEDDLNSPSFSESIYWFHQKQSIPGILEIPDSFESIVYLKGSSINSFLKQNRGPDTEKTYCLVFDFKSSLLDAQYRVRAVPENSYNFQNNQGEFTLRVDLNQENQSCQGELDNTTEFTLALNAVCPDCRNAVSSTIKLYEVNPTAQAISEETLVTDLDRELSIIRLKINNTIVKGEGGPSCTHSQCTARDYHCCLEGQCVYDGHERENIASLAQEDPLGLGIYYNEAKHRVSLNPSLFTKYPDIYYVCPQSIPPDSSSSSTSSLEAIERAEENLRREIAEYHCLQEEEKEDPNYTSCSDQNNDEAVDEIDLEIVKKIVWQRLRCVCKTPSRGELYCSDYKLKVETDPSSGAITRVLCDNPDTIGMPKPQQELSIKVSSRSVPHRFFREDTGKPVDDLSSLSEEEYNIQAEGMVFSYLDDKEKREPDNNSYNMNAILGQMSVDLSQAHPAKAVPVEMGQNYVIMAKSGTYIPCPECSKDSWNPGFMAHPPVEDGVGLQAAGRTTRRDIFDDFIPIPSLGNYEDTSFGRACWIPPTMIPFTHRPDTNVSRQRKRRLTAQAALYINGYQKDWYGFNKGALIGSFDGVTWFAIGKGRKVTASSNRLYLAINAPFGDLADSGEIDVSVITDLGNNQAATLDYHHDLPKNDPLLKQNQGATCRQYHLCENDIDCVTRLGWEYMCADITFYRSGLPVFDTRANEKARSETPGLLSRHTVWGSIPYL